MEKELSIKELATACDLPISCFFKLGTDGYGTPRPNTYGIWYSEIAKSLGVNDYYTVYTYPKEVWDRLELVYEQLEKSGFRVVNPIVGSFVHGYDYRKIYRN